MWGKNYWNQNLIAFNHFHKCMNPIVLKFEPIFSKFSFKVDFEKWERLPRPRQRKCKVFLIGDLQQMKYQLGIQIILF